ncbi:MAG: hypothetical protein RBQ88_09120 [Desulfobulbus oligotrophicus]|jgi:DNA-directed RNA polymerase subunit F|nr:hypothetical protein [Desulfobulbus oligotrophicus]
MAEPIKNNQLDFRESNPIVLTSRQKQVLEILNTAKSQKYSLADWYHGALYAAKNKHNPDRFCQAAQSLRELLEKLPRVFVESDIPELRRPNFLEMRRKLYSRLRSDKTRYQETWKDETIDTDLEKTILNAIEYFELAQKPTRREKIDYTMSKIDPMHDTLDQRIRSEKSKQFQNVWNFFEGLAHHNSDATEELFWQNLSLVERIILDLLAPITAQDQGAIRAILKKPQPEQDDIKKLLELIKRRGANYVYFFKEANSPAWIKPLLDNGFFKNPPDVERIDDQITISVWWPIFYLQRISQQSPKEVVDILLTLKTTDNPRILREAFVIACDLEDTALSLRLTPLIKEFLKSPYEWGKEDLIIKILKKWGKEQGDSRDAAYKIIQYVVAFQPDPEEDEKQSRRKDNPENWSTSLKPTPRFNEWRYQQILEKGVRPLAEHEPYQVSRILIDAVASMIRMGIHPEDLEKRNDQDYSHYWCLRLDRPDPNYQDEKEILVQTLTYACEQVYENVPESIDALDQALRNHRWRVFKRLRQHLYALHPNDQTLPWIREEILGHNDYPKWEHHYEFQLMIRKASEHFGPRLLSEEEQKGIFNTILSGPSKEDFREWMGEQYSEEAFQQRQRNFHRRQLRPFAALLRGEVWQYFDELAKEATAGDITDESYSPISMTGGVVSYQSPQSAEDLEKLTDEELLTYLNHWDDERRDHDNNRLVEINISALAGVFQSVFKKRIVPDDTRLKFWLTHRNRIARPVYVVAMLKAMLELVKEKNFKNLGQWLKFSAWVSSHPDTPRKEGQPEPQEKFRDHPDWGRSRRAVVDFIDACVNKDTDAPITARDGLYALLNQVCTQPDRRLDHDHPVLLNRDDPITEAINNTRSRALESLVNFGFWVHRHVPEDPLPEVTEILEKRLSKDAKIPLTRPEYALLGMHFRNLRVLNQDWAAQQREIFFPQADKAVWRDAFGSYIRFNRPAKLTFEILRSEFEYAIENLNILAPEKGDGKELIDRLGQHLFTYYLWGVYPLTGDESLLERFYEKTKNDPKRWGQLFDHVGRSLRNSGRHLDKTLTDRIIAFFDWRFEAAEPLELQKFTFWLEAECLNPDWRLRSYSKILYLGRGKDVGLSLEVRVLNKLLPNHLALVVECFAKITDALDQGTQMYISDDEAKPILKAGLTAEDPQVLENAKRAQDNLLRLGRSDFLDIE